MRLRVAADPARAAVLSSRLRHDQGEDMRARRRAIALNLGALGALSAVAAYQVGLVRRLPEPPLPGLDSEKVDASADAYRWFATPDGVLGLLSYAATIALAAMGDPGRARQSPLIPLAYAGKLAFDLAQSVRLTFEQIAKQRAMCWLCIVASLATVASAATAIRETNAAIGELRTRLRQRAQTTPPPVLNRPGPGRSAD